MLTRVEPQSYLQLYGVASCLGAQDQGCHSSPQRLADSGLIATLKQLGINAQWQQILALKHSSSDSLPLLYQQLAQHVQRATQQKSPFLVIGGDHSCAIGTWSGAAMSLRQQDTPADLGLIWIDAHMDAHTPKSSPSGALHGMPLACLLGYGDKKYCDIGYSGLKVKPENVCLIGVRSYEKEEAQLLSQIGVQVFFIEDIRSHGLDKIMRLATAHVSRHTGGFGISIDLDAIDPQDAPGVGSPEKNGIHRQELLSALSVIAENTAKNAAQLIGAEITELNPERDIEQKTQTLVTDIIHSIFGDL